MTTRREALKKYLGQEVKGVTAFLSERRGGRNGYGYLLTFVKFPGGEYIDHCWIGGGEGCGCVQWREGTDCIGESIKFTAFVDEYFSAGAERRGDHRAGIGITAIEDVEVFINGEWQPIEYGVKLVRKEKVAARSKPGHVWSGSWTYSDGDICVRAAKSARPSDLCEVRSREGLHDETVILKEGKNGIWLWDYLPERKIQVEKEKAEEAKSDAIEEAWLKNQKEKETQGRIRTKLVDRYLSLRTERGRKKLAALHPTVPFSEYLSEEIEPPSGGKQ